MSDPNPNSPSTSAVPTSRSGSRRRLFGFLGAAVVIASGLYLLYRERKVGPRRGPVD